MRDALLLVAAGVIVGIPVAVVLGRVASTDLGFAVPDCRQPIRSRLSRQRYYWP